MVMDEGILYALGAYIIWGLFPVYWKWLEQVPATQLIGHRIVWSFLLLLAVVLITRQGGQFRSILSKGRIVRIYAAAALLLGVNWLTYVWAVTSGYIIESSLGYFINPLLSVLLGMIFLHERLRPWQWLAVGLATVGVIYLTFTYGRLPWIALTLALTFGVYGLVTKMAPLGSLFGLILETGLLFLPALLYLVVMGASGSGAFLHVGATADLLLVGAGAVTAVPLLMFASAAQRIPLTLVGIMQYIAPTLQFLLGLLVYKEAFSSTQFVGYGTVWMALIIFWGEGWIASRRRLPPRTFHC